MRIPKQSDSAIRSSIYNSITRHVDNVSPQQFSPFIPDLDLVAYPTCQRACSACWNPSIPGPLRYFYYCRICYGICGL